jgi:hypothetical protein
VAASATGAAVADGTANAATIFADGETLTVDVGGESLTLEFTVDPSDVAIGAGNTRVDLNDGVGDNSIDDVLATIEGAIQGQGGNLAAVTVGVSGGNIEISTGAAGAGDLTVTDGTGGSDFGGNATASDTNAAIGALSGTLTIGTDTLTFGAGNIENRGQLETALGALATPGVSASIDGSNFLSISAADTDTSFAVGGTLDASAAFGVAEETYSATNARTGCNSRQLHGDSRQSVMAQLKPLT